MDGSILFIFILAPRYRILLAFSVYTNGKKIIAVNQQSGQILFFNGMKVISMFWVVLGHRFEINDFIAINKADVAKVSFVFFSLPNKFLMTTSSGKRNGTQCM